MNAPVNYFVHWFASLPISIVALHSIMLGTITSAAEFDGWINWGHEASVLMVVPIVAWAVCVYVNGPIRPIRINGRLGWAVEDLRRLLAR